MGVLRHELCRIMATVPGGGRGFTQRVSKGKDAAAHLLTNWTICMLVMYFFHHGVLRMTVK